MPLNALDKSQPGALLGTQALFRGLAIIDAIAGGSKSLESIGIAIGCSRSTTHRIIQALTRARYIRHMPDRGYVLGPKLMELGFSARAQMPIQTVARGHLEALASETGDSVHLGIRDGNTVLYVDKIQGTRGLEIRSSVGYHNPLASTGLGKALMLDMDEAQWREMYEAAQGLFKQSGLRPPTVTPWQKYLKRMQNYASLGYAVDLEENEPGIRCVAAPIRDFSGGIVAAISVASAIQYMPDQRMQELWPSVMAIAGKISRELGCSEQSLG
jgi:DNA-binding IclR family transcriptional regulator